jgi:tetratricopeptide (TPR) repeat protein
MLDPAMPAAWVNLSAALLALAQQRAARAAARWALVLTRDDPDALHCLARAHAALSDLARAGDCLRATLRRAPYRAEA